MRVAVPTELGHAERRVALTPTAVAKLVDLGHEVVVESGAGQWAGFTDDAYRQAGAASAARSEVIDPGGVIVGIGGPADPADPDPDLSLLGPDHIVVALHDPLGRPEQMAGLAATGATVVALELIPRTTRAQAMDVLSSMATIVGYEAALLVASRLPRLLPLLMTAAGTVPAARVLVLGAGVAGLQAIATSRRLGAVVEGYDVRSAAMEQIRSLGARAIDLELDTSTSEDGGGYARAQTDDTTHRQHELLAPHVAEADGVITTAAIPGATSPELVTPAMVESMSSGSVIVDLASDRGGNCRLTRPDDEVVHHGVTILGPTDLASRAATTASQLFATNLVALLQHLAPEGKPVFDRDDEITAGVLVATGGEVVHPQVQQRLTAAASDRPETES
jgi:NAD(P) transhydrogenase subunit alpha